MSARDAILAALAPPAPVDPARLAAEAGALVADLEHPPLAEGGPVDALRARLAQPGLGATCATIPGWSALPGEVARYLDDQADGPGLYLPPDPRLDALDWGGVARLATCPVDGGAALAVAVAAVAETGSLVLDTAGRAPMLPNFLALHHLVVVEAGRIVRWLEDVPPPAAVPRQRSWITGVSGTTDIEGQYVRGAHGPRFLHVIVVEDAGSDEQS